MSRDWMHGMPPRQTVRSPIVMGWGLAIALVPLGVAMDGTAQATEPRDWTAPASLAPEFAPSFVQPWGSAIAAIAPQTMPTLISQVGPKNEVATSDVLSILQKLPQPNSAPAERPALFMANAYGQQGLNFQAQESPEAAVEFYRQALTELGYRERTVNATMGAWGFSIVFDPPASLGLQPTRDQPISALQVGDSLTVQESDGRSVVLVLQGTMLSPEMLNTNIRFEEI